MFDFLAGYRTKLGSVALILSGAAIVVNAISSGHWQDAMGGIASIGAGLAALGIRFASVTASGAATAAGKQATGG